MAYSPFALLEVDADLMIMENSVVSYYDPLKHNEPTCSHTPGNTSITVRLDVRSIV